MSESPEQLSRLRELFPFAVALVIGALGGCSMALSRMAKQRQAEWIAFTLMAYALVGAVGALMGVAMVAIVVPSLIDTFAKIVFVSGLFGICAATGLLSANMIMRVVFKQLGIDVEIKIHRDE